MRAWHVKVLANIKPYWLNFLRGQLNVILEAQHILLVLQGERTYYITQLHVLHRCILLRQNEDIPILITKVMVVLHEVLTDHGHSSRALRHLFFSFVAFFAYVRFSLLNLTYFDQNQIKLLINCIL